MSDQMTAIVRRQRERIEELEEELRQLKAEAASRSDRTWDGWKVKIPWLAPAMALIVQETWALYPRPVSRLVLNDLYLPSRRKQDVDWKVWDVQVCKLRRVVREAGGPNCMVTVYGIGWAMTARGRDWFDAKWLDPTRPRLPQSAPPARALPY